MNTEFGALSSEVNPFAAMLSPDIVFAAHERLASRVTGTVYRPLERGNSTPAQRAVARFDAEVDREDSGWRSCDERD